MNIKEMVHDYVANVQKEKQTEAEMEAAAQDYVNRKRLGK